MKYGLRAGIERNLHFNQDGLPDRVSYTADVVKVGFTQHGFERFSFAGTPLAQRDIDGRIRFAFYDKDDESSGMSTTHKILWGAIILGGVAVVAASANPRLGNGDN